MCDYSLENADQRQAQSNETLVTARMGEHRTVGLISPGKPKTAVCLVAGTRARINISPRMSRDFRLPAGPALATFTQRELPDGKVDYRDGFLFDDAPDKQLLLQEFDIDVAIVPMGIESEIVHERELVDA